MKEKLKQKEGATLVIAVVILLVCTMLALLLLNMSSSVSRTMSKQSSLKQAKELATSISLSLEKEIVETNPATKDELISVLESNQTPLWNYLRINLLQKSWPYYAQELFHSHQYSDRYFNITGHDILENVSIKMYYESEQSALRTDGTDLIVEVSCEIGKQKATIKTTYDIKIETYKGIKEGQDYKPSNNNPELNVIDVSERWSISKSFVE